jgi:hypothetical protein
MLGGGDIDNKSTAWNAEMCWHECEGDVTNECGGMLGVAVVMW